MPGLHIAEAESAEDIAGMLPGPRLAGGLAELSLGGLDDRALVEVMRASRRLTSWAESLELAAISELEGRRTAQADRYGSWTLETSRALCDEVSAALTLSGTAAALRLGLAGMLVERLPRTGRALAEGRVDSAKARAICDGVLGIGDAIARKAEDLVLPDAPRLTARQVAARVRKAVIDADPEAYERRRKVAVQGRRVEVYDNPDGTADLSARNVPADEADAAYNYVNALAKAIKGDGDPRSIDAIRADVLLQLLRGVHPADLFPAATDPEHGPQATLTGPAAEKPRGTEGDTGRDEAAAIAEVTHEQLTDLLGTARAQGGPAERRLLIAQAAHRIKDALAPLNIRWCALAVDTDGDPVHGHHGYRPPAAMRRLVQARDGTCTFPTCNRAAARCDLDHTTPYDKGGPTCPCNLAALCRSHHRLKQHPDWTLIHLWPGVLLWITPTGHWYLTGPAP